MCEFVCIRLTSRCCSLCPTISGATLKKRCGSNVAAARRVLVRCLMERRKPSVVRQMIWLLLMMTKSRDVLTGQEVMPQSLPHWPHRFPHIRRWLPPPNRLCFTWQLSVCLLSASHKNYSLDLRENFTRDVSIDMEALVTFRKSSASGSGSRNILKDSLTWPGRAFFHSLAHVSWKKWLHLHENFIRDVSLDKEGAVWTEQLLADCLISWSCDLACRAVQCWLSNCHHFCAKLQLTSRNEKKVNRCYDVLCLVSVSSGCTTWTLLLVVSLLLLHDSGTIFLWTVKLLHLLTHLRSGLRH